MTDKLFITYERDDGFLRVLAGSVSDAQQSSIRKVIRRDDISIGLRDDLSLGYVCIDSADKHGDVFAVIRGFIERGEEIPRKVLYDAYLRCRKILLDLINEYVKSKALVSADISTLEAVFES